MSHYIIRVEGLLSSGLIASFPSLEATQHAETVLHGSLHQQSELALVLGRLGDLGVDVVEVHRLPDTADASGT